MRTFLLLQGAVAGRAECVDRATASDTLGRLDSDWPLPLRIALRGHLAGREVLVEKRDFAGAALVAGAPGQQGRDFQAHLRLTADPSWCA